MMNSDLGKRLLGKSNLDEIMQSSAFLLENGEYDSVIYDESIKLQYFSTCHKGMLTTTN